MTSNDNKRELLTTILLSAQSDALNHYLLVQSTMESQRVLLDRLTVLAHRYNLLTNGLSPKRTCPPEASHNVEDDIIAEFFVKLQNIHESNSKLTESLENFSTTCNNLDRFLNETHEDILSLWPQDDATQQPISFYLELFADCRKFFTRLQSHLNCLASMFKPDSASSVERYKKQLDPDREFNEHFLKSIAHCKRLHTKNKKPNT